MRFVPRHLCRSSIYRSVSFAVLLILIILPILSFPSPAFAQGDSLCDSPANPIVAENCKEGTRDWHITNIYFDIEGFASLTSVTIGETLDFYVNTSAAEFDLLIYRSGYYQGLGGRLVYEAKGLGGTNQPQCESDRALGLVDCVDWAKSYSLEIPSDWVSGVYIAKLVRHDTGGENYITFVVRESKPRAEMVMQLSVTTYQAYNFYGNKSLYSSLSFNYCPTDTEAARAAQVSFNRPNSLGVHFQNAYFWTDFPMVYWLEAQGYDVGYITNIDTHRFGSEGNANELLKHKAFLSVGHDEYWSQEMRDAITAARDAGVHLAFFSANTAYWRIRMEADGNGTPDRTIAVYKTAETGPADPTGFATTTWRDPAINDPENSLVGIQYVGDNDSHYFPLQVTSEQAQDAIYRNTPLQTMPADSIARVGTHLIGWEWDAIADNGKTPASLSLLAESPAVGLTLADGGGAYAPRTANAHVTRYIAPSGAIVFAAGTNQWTWGLATYEPNPIVQQVTYNLFADMGVQPATPATTLTLDAVSGVSEQRQVSTWDDAELKSGLREFLSGIESSDFVFADSASPAFVVIPNSDVQGVTISNIQTSTTADSVTVSWRTDLPASGELWVKRESGAIDYSLTAERIGETPVAGDALREAPATHHEFTIDGLLPNEDYFIHVASTNEFGVSAVSEEVQVNTSALGSPSLLAKRYLRPLFREAKCSFDANPVGFGVSALVIALLAGIALWWLTFKTKLIYKSARFMLSVVQRINWEKTLLAALIVLAVFSLLYNLQLSPRTWHDEGSAMLLARTLAEDGVYYVRNSDGYQSFGAVQSIGPTVVLPVALSFKLFGVGLLQGRLVSVLLAFATLMVIYRLAKALFGFYPAVLGMFLLIGSASAQFVYFGRQPLGEVTALGLFVGGWYCWYMGILAKGMKERNLLQKFFPSRWHVLTGVLLGLSMVTKSSYIVLGGGVLVALVLMDLVYYRRGEVLSLLGISIIAFALAGGWVFFQQVYYGGDEFAKNAGYMSQLGAATTGFSLFNIYLQALFLLGSKNNYFYFMLGIPALLYGVYLSLRAKDERAALTAALTLFAGAWLAYYFYSVPWPAYLFVPSALVALLVAKLWSDVIVRFGDSVQGLSESLEQRRYLPLVRTGFIYFTLFAFVLYPLQNTIQFHVLGRDSAPQQVAEFLDRTVQPGDMIETWERELGALTDHLYHFPDQSRLIDVHAAKYRQSSQAYLLGNDYFNEIQPAYLVIGRFAREFPLYDPAFIEKNATLVATFGSDGLGQYEIYEIHYPLLEP